MRGDVLRRPRVRASQRQQPRARLRRPRPGSRRPGDVVEAELVDGRGCRDRRGDRRRRAADDDPAENVAGIAARRSSRARRPRPRGSTGAPGVRLCVHKQMPLASGLGSSAASSVAGAMAVNELFGRPLSRRELLPHALEGERAASGAAHADNAAPEPARRHRAHPRLRSARRHRPSRAAGAVDHGRAPALPRRTADARALVTAVASGSQTVANLGNLGAMVTASTGTTSSCSAGPSRTGSSNRCGRPYSRVRGGEASGAPGRRARLLDLRVWAVGLRVRRQRRRGRRIAVAMRDAFREAAGPRERQLRRPGEHGRRLSGG